MDSEHGYALPTDTAHIRIEGRQYRLLGVDLGEGLVRSKIMVALAISGPWVAFMAILGVPLLQRSYLYLAPAAVLTMMALRPDPGGRPRYAIWLDRWRYLLRRGQTMAGLRDHYDGRPIYAGWGARRHATGRRLARLLHRTPTGPGPAMTTRSPRPFVTRPEWVVLDVTTIAAKANKTTRSSSARAKTRSF